MKAALLLSLLASLVMAQAPAQQFPHPQPAAPGDFPMMAWDSAPSDPDLLRGMKDAGFNVAGFCEPGDLERVRGAGLSCFLGRPERPPYDWKNPPGDAQIASDVAALARKYAGNPTVLGFFLNDEPQTPQLAAIGRVAVAMRKAMPDKVPFVNLFPYREGQAEWYTNYEEYVRSLVELTHQSFISFDNYSLSYAGMGDEFFVNLEIVRRVAQQKGIPFWACRQAVAHFGYLVPSDATLHLQVYSALAYGARGLEYFTYLTPERGNYRMAAIDQFGNRTPTWEALRRINSEVHALAPTLLRLRSTGVYHYPDVPKQGRALSDSRLVRWISMTKDEDQFVPPAVAARFLVGEFEDDAGHAYLMIVNKDLTYSFQFEIEYKRAVQSVKRVNPYSGATEPFTGEQNWVAPGGGVLLLVE